MSSNNNELRVDSNSNYAWLNPDYPPLEEKLDPLPDPEKAPVYQSINWGNKKFEVNPHWYETEEAAKIAGKILIGVCVVTGSAAVIGALTVVSTFAVTVMIFSVLSGTSLTTGIMGIVILNKKEWPGDPAFMTHVGKKVEKFLLDEQFDNHDVERLYGYALQDFKVGSSPLFTKEEINNLLRRDAYKYTLNGFLLRHNIDIKFLDDKNRKALIEHDIRTLTVRWFLQAYKNYKASDILPVCSEPLKKHLEQKVAIWVRHNEKEAVEFAEGKFQLRLEELGIDAKQLQITYYGNLFSQYGQKKGPWIGHDYESIRLEVGENLLAELMKTHFAATIMQHFVIPNEARRLQEGKSDYKQFRMRVGFEIIKCLSDESRTWLKPYFLQLPMEDLFTGPYVADYDIFNLSRGDVYDAVKIRFANVTSYAAFMEKEGAYPYTYGDNSPVNDPSLKENLMKLFWEYVKQAHFTDIDNIEKHAQSFGVTRKEILEKRWENLSLKAIMLKEALDFGQELQLGNSLKLSDFETRFYEETKNMKVRDLVNDPDYKILVKMGIIANQEYLKEIRARLDNEMKGYARFEDFFAHYPRNIVNVLLDVESSRPFKALVHGYVVKNIERILINKEWGDLIDEKDHSQFVTAPVYNLLVEGQKSIEKDEAEYEKRRAHLDASLSKAKSYQHPELKSFIDDVETYDSQFLSAQGAVAKILKERDTTEKECDNIKKAIADCEQKKSGYIFEKAQLPKDIDRLKSLIIAPGPIQHEINELRQQLDKHATLVGHIQNSEKNSRLSAQIHSKMELLQKAQKMSQELFNKQQRLAGIDKIIEGVDDQIVQLQKDLQAAKNTTHQSRLSGLNDKLEAARKVMSSCKEQWKLANQKCHTEHEKLASKLENDLQKELQAEKKCKEIVIEMTRRTCGQLLQR